MLAAVVVSGFSRHPLRQASKHSNVYQCTAVILHQRNRPVVWVQYYSCALVHNAALACLQILQLVACNIGCCFSPLQVFPLIPSDNDDAEVSECAQGKLAVKPRKGTGEDRQTGRLSQSGCQWRLLQSCTRAAQ